MSQVILFLCVANSARSQLAEALARSMARDDVEVFSAGSQPTRLHPLAARVLGEVGLAADGLFAKGLSDVPLARVDTVITLCSEEDCPTLPETVVHLHWPMPDPAVDGLESERAVGAFRSVRDQIAGRLREWMSASGLAVASA